MGTMDCQSGCYASYHDDPANCGMCGTKCAVDQVCIMGQCEAYSTPKGCSTCPCTSQCSGGTMCCKQFVGNIPIAAVPLPICVAGGSCG